MAGGFVSRSRYVFRFAIRASDHKGEASPDEPLSPHLAETS